MTAPSGRLDGMQSRQRSPGDAGFLAGYVIALKDFIHRFDRFPEPAVVPGAERRVGHKDATPVRV